MTKGSSKKTSCLKVTRTKTSTPSVSIKGKRLKFNGSSRSPLSTRDRLTKRCSVSLDDAWNEGVIGKRLRSEACVSYRLWIEERDKLEKWKKTYDLKPNKGKSRHANNKTKQSIYGRTKKYATKEKNETKEKNGFLAKESRNVVLKKRKRKNNDDDDASRSSNDPNGGDGENDHNSSTSEDSDQSNDEDSSDDGKFFYSEN